MSEESINLKKEVCAPNRGLYLMKRSEPTRKEAEKKIFNSYFDVLQKLLDKRVFRIVEILFGTTISLYYLLVMHSYSILSEMSYSTLCFMFAAGFGIFLVADGTWSVLKCRLNERRKGRNGRKSASCVSSPDLRPAE